MKAKKLICILAVSAMTLAISACGSKTPEESGNPEGTAPKTTADQNTNNTESENTNNSADSSTSQNSGKINEDKAKEISLKSAGLEESAVTSLHIKLDKDDGVEEYEVNFYAGGKEYDYDIDAATGKIRSSDIDIDDDHQNKTDAADSQSFELTEAKAKKIVLAKVKGAAEANLRIKRDLDDGRPVYEGELIHDNKKYEFEIDGNTGDVFEWDVE